MSAAAGHPSLERVRIWEWPVRLSHWLIAGSIGVLAVTGIYIGHPFFESTGQATRHFVMGTIKAVHFWAAMLFTVAVLGRVLWMFTGNPYARWKEFLPVTRQRLAGIWPTFAFYTFLRRQPPRYVGHNPLAGAIYSLVFGLYFVMIASGFALASANARPDSFLADFSFLAGWLGGLQMARFIHHVAMWLLLGFVAHHVWSAFLIASVEKRGLFEAIFTGHKFLPPAEAEQARARIETDR
jgi:Ni/Fe-hydrogenase 1 B-type cytochrome subunit